MLENLYPLIILLPLIGAAVIGIFGFVSESFRKMEKVIGGVATLMVAVPFIFITYAFFTYHGDHAIHFDLWSWMTAGNMDVRLGYNMDQLSLLMGMIVTGVGSLIHIYSIGYMHGDKGYYKFFLYLNLFIFSMLNLILGDNLVVLFLGWEGVGACSYFLIGFWYEDMAKAAAAQKAFIANRIGDFAMIVAMMIIYSHVGSLQLDEIVRPEYWEGGDSPAAWVGFLVLVAATGKSAQIPLFVWLPDAMAGPTPVSALIHAATMVTSGIYLIARIGVVYEHAPNIMMLVSIVGAATALLAALIAIAQNDIKKVLAYSTVSQLGFMFMALGAGAFTTAIFHVMTHAFFKACLFLGSGSVIHAMDHMHTVKDGQDIRTMGNLKKYMPSTHMTFLISTLAIAGIPILSGFFSKDEILGKVFMNGHENIIYYLIYAVGFLTAALTAFYMTRVYFLTFRGSERFPDEKKPHESPITMTAPLWILAALAAVAGFLGLPDFIGEHGSLNWISHHWLGGGHGHAGAVSMEHIGSMHASLVVEYILMFLSAGLAIGVVAFTWKFYTKHSLAGDEIIKGKLGKFYHWMENKFFVDEFYEMALLKPFVLIGEKVIMAFDKDVLDGGVNGLGKLMNFFGDLFKRMQTGFVAHYALIMVVGVIIILGYLTWPVIFG